MQAVFFFIMFLCLKETLALFIPKENLSNDENNYSNMLPRNGLPQTGMPGRRRSSNYFPESQSSGIRIRFRANRGNTPRLIFLRRHPNTNMRLRIQRDMIDKFGSFRVIIKHNQSGLSDTSGRLHSENNQRQRPRIIVRTNSEGQTTFGRITLKTLMPTRIRISKRTSNY